MFLLGLDSGIGFWDWILGRVLGWALDVDSGLDYGCILGWILGWAMMKHPTLNVTPHNLNAHPRYDS